MEVEQMGEWQRSLRLRVCLGWWKRWTDECVDVGRWKEGWWESRVICMEGGSWTEDRRPVLVSKPDMLPWDPAVCRSTPGGVWGWASECTEEYEGLAIGWAYQSVHYPPLPNLLPEMPVQMAICQGWGLHAWSRGWCQRGTEPQCWMFYYNIYISEYKNPTGQVKETNHE